MKKVLIGCGIATLVVVLLLVGIGAVFFSWFKGQMEGTENLKDLRREMVEQYGEPEDYVPALNGTLDPDRVAIFVSLREDLLDERAQVAAEIEEIVRLARDNEGRERNLIEKIGHAVNLGRRGVAIWNKGFEYLGRQTEKQLEVGMGDGEATFLFGLMAYAWLDWDPIEAIGEEAFESYDLLEEAEDFHAEGQRRFVRQLRNLRRALDDLPDPSPEQRALREQLVAELEAHREDREHFPLRGALPPDWDAALAPYRARFEATLPRTPIECLLESVDLESEDHDGVQIRINE